MLRGAGAAQPVLILRRTLGCTASSTASTLPPLSLMVLPSSRLTHGSQHPQETSGTLAQCWLAAFPGPGLLASPALFLLSAAHGHSSSHPGQNCLPSADTLQAPLFSRGQGFARGLPCAHPEPSLGGPVIPEKVWAMPFANHPLPTILDLTCLQTFILKKILNK